MAGSGAKAIFIYKAFDQKLGNWKDLFLNFVQYLGTGAGEE